MSDSADRDGRRKPHSQRADFDAERRRENETAKTAPNAAPDDTPVIEGSASGFLKRLCMPAPASARLAPESTAAARRGSLICHTTRFAVSSEDCKNSAERTSAHESPPDPEQSDAAANAANASVKTANAPAFMKSGTPF